MSIFEISSDKPVINPKEDSLGYAEFSKNIASSLIKGDFKDGLVISIYGEWGAGKSTVLSFIEHNLLHDDTDIEIIRFNPWWFSSEEALLLSFFSQLQSVFKTWKSKGKTIVNKISIISDILAKTSVEAKVVNVFLKKVLSTSTDIVKIKKDIENLLNEEKKKIVVIIDDIDRLTGDEAKQVFKIIKAVADFPYVIYILAFDKNVVSKSLERSLNVDGNSYIEKIIQVPFELPLPEENSLSDLFIHKINKLFFDVPEKEHDDTYFGNMYHDGIKYFFKTPRDVIRLTNAVSVTFPPIINEVNHVDFLAIECLRVFEPQVYDGIRRNQELFCGVADIQNDHTTELYKERILKIINNLQTATSKNIQDLIIRLFPRLESILGNLYYDSDIYRSWRRNKRVCSNEYFPVYFRSSLSIDSISSTELKKILTISSDIDELSNWLFDLCTQKLTTGKSRLTIILERAIDYLDELSTDQKKNIIITFFDIGDDLLIEEDEQEGMYSFGGNDLRLGRVLYKLLPSLDDHIRFDILKKSYKSGNSVVLMSRELVIFAQQHGKYGSDSVSSTPFITLDQVKELEEITLDKIRDLAAKGKLKLDQNIVSILYRWKQWSGNQESSVWLQSQIDDNLKNVLLTIKAFISNSYSHGMSDRIATKHTKISIKGISNFVDLVDFEKKVRELSESGLDDNERSLVTLFQRDYTIFIQGLTDQS
jgi:predicted KAP-like P-loop ATPase